MEFTAALIREQGIEFGVVLVTAQAAQPGRREATLQGVASVFAGKPVILCSQDSRGVPSYFGRPDLVRFLANVSLDRLPWKKWRLNAA
ncbi:MAG: hypothetical protein QOJ11_1404 [Frankiales bacterium]|jgi:hypothetical protein|nr:hypothetical protein [Frankiales bacterium]